MAQYTYLVTEGEYSDYQIVASFGADREAAEEFAERYNAMNTHTHAQVEEEPVRPKGWFGEEHARASTRVRKDTGEVIGMPEYSERIRWFSAPARPEVDRYTTWWLGQEVTNVVTTGRPGHVRQAHSDAVAKLRAEILGL